MTVLAAEVTQRLDAAGQWRASVPLTDPRTAQASVGRYWLQYREGEGLAFAGMIENLQKTPEDKLEISGPTILGELALKTVLIGTAWTNTALNTIIDGLLPAGWTRSGSIATTMTGSFGGDQRLRALITAIEQVSGAHLRELITESGGVLTKQVEIGSFGASSGIILMGGNPDKVLLEDSGLAAVESISVEETSQEVWNYVIPLGADWDSRPLSLKHSTRTTPYTIQSTAGPDGTLNYYLSDAASIATYGQRERPFVAKDIKPLSNTKAALQAAANALYDLAVKQLSYWTVKQTAYKLTVRGLSPSLKPGDKVRLRYRGYAQHWGTGYVYLDVDTDLWVLERTRRFFDDGTEQSELVVSDVARQLQSANEVVIAKLEDTSRAFKTKVQPSVSNSSAGPLIEAVGGGYTADFDLVIQDNVTQLLRCQVRFKPRAFRNTTTGAASGGSQTPTTNSGGSSSPTTSAGGGQYPTTSAGGDHHHNIFTTGAGGQAAPTDWINMVGIDSGGSNWFARIGNYDASGPSKTIRTYTASGTHNHGSITVIEHDHGSIQVPSHDHGTINVTAHTHTAVDAISESGGASSMTITINGVSRTAALGGPWNTAQTKDITTYLLDADGVVIQGVHTIRFGSSALGRIEVWIDKVEVVQALVAA